MRWLEFRRQHKRRKLARKGFAQTDKIRRRENPDSARNGHSRPRHSLLSLFLFVFIWAICSLSIGYRPQTPATYYIPGQIADKYIQSELPFEYDDLEQTYARRQHVAASVVPIYRIDDAVVEESLTALDLFRQAIMVPAAGEGIPDGQSIAETGGYAGGVQHVLAKLRPDERKTLADIAGTPEKWRVLVDLISEGLHAGVLDPQTILDLRSRAPVITRITAVSDSGGTERRSTIPFASLRSPEILADEISGSFLTGFPGNEEITHAALRDALTVLIKVNLAYDAQATQHARETAIASVKPVKRFIPANTVLLRRGDVIRDEDIRLLERHQQELNSERSLARQVDVHLIRPLLCLLLLGAACYCLRVARPEVYDDRGLLVMIAIIVVFQAVINRLTMYFYASHFESSFFLPSLLPLSLAAALASPLMGLRTAMLGGAFTTAIAALQHGSERSFQLFLLGLLSSLAGASLMRRARKRSHALQAIGGIAATVFIVELLHALQGTIPLETLRHVLPTMLGCAVANGLVVASSASLMQWVFEWGFGVTTTRSLAELNDLNHPLLKRLQLEAPGTYHHSLMVATLAEQAAEAIGADPLLARVCAYFHDIGKLAHPEYFTENSRGENPHHDLQPRMSALVILNHVKEGIDLALKYKLKRPIREAISQHHGTSLVFYFYRMAMDQHREPETNGQTVGEQDYRYPGPLPRRKEIALISIADACEAAARSLEKPTPQKIEALVNEIVLKRIRDHQLAEADLTFAELARAQKQIAKTLSLMLHGRIQYPKEYDNETDLFQAAAEAAAKKPAPPAKGHPGNSASERA